MSGAAGHMSHLHEDLFLTFGELKESLSAIARTEIRALEKVDGLNLFLTIDELGNVRTARNGSDIKKGGMTTEEYASKWKDHPARSVFMNGFEVISQALDVLSYEEKMDIFQNGTRYLNMEIMYYNPETQSDANIINYGANYIVMHNLNTNDPSSQSAFQKLVEALNESQINVDQENWEIYGPAVITLNNLEDSEAHQSMIESLDNLAARVGGDENTRLLDFAKVGFESFLNSNGFDESQSRDLTEIVFRRLDDPSFKGTTEFNAFKKSLTGNQDLKKKASLFGTKTNSKKIIEKSVLLPVERIISDFAIEVLRGINSAFVVDHDRAVNKLKQDLQRAILKIQRLDTEDKIGLARQLEKLGDIESNVSSSLEGIVFKAPNGRTYKITGAFAMVNQIINKAMRLKEPDQVSESKIRRIIREAIRRRLNLF